MLFSYYDVEEALALRHCIPNDTRISLLSSIRHFERLNFPPRTSNCCHGRANCRSRDYSPWQLLLLACAFELIQIGITPEQSLNWIIPNIQAIKAGVGAEIEQQERDYPRPGDVLVMFQPEILGVVQGLGHNKTHAKVKAGMTRTSELRSIGSAIIVAVAGLIDVCLAPAGRNAIREVEIRQCLKAWGSETTGC